MNKVPKDVLIDIALDLSLPDLLSLCQSSSTAFICYSDVFWSKKLKQDYGISGVKNPKEVYKNIPIFKEHCKNLISKKIVDQDNIVLYDINGDYFDEFSNYIVFKYLLGKILSRGAGLSNYYIVEHNKIPNWSPYKQMISADQELSYDEYKIFINLLTVIKKSPYTNSFEGAYIDMMIKGNIPFDVKWGQICNYNIY